MMDHTMPCDPTDARALSRDHGDAPSRDHGGALSRDHGGALSRDESFRALFDENPLPMWVFDSQTWRFLMVNQAAIDFYGWSRGEFMAMTLDDVGRDADQFQLPARGGLGSMVNHASWRQRRADGSTVHMAGVMRAHPLGGPHAMMLMLWDETDMRVAQEELQRTNQRLTERTAQLQARTAELSETNRLAQLGIWRLSADRAVMTWSDEIYRLIGRDRGAFPPSFANSIQVIHPDDRDLSARSTPVRGSDCGARQVEARIVRPDGRLRHVRIEFRPVDAAVERGALLGTIQDVSERWETQQALMRSEKLAILGHLTGGIAHDFNNILTVVTLNLEEVIEELPKSNELRPILQAALVSAQRGADLTAQLLAYARQAPLRPLPTSLTTLFQTFSPLVIRALGAKHVLRTVIADADCTPMIDSAQLQSAILNIALNARDAMPEGGEVVIAASKIALPSADHPLEAVTPGLYAMIGITDHGVGIAEDVVPFIFEPFYTTKTSGSSSGLGLSMVDGFIAQSGGRISVQSKCGQGTTIRLFLPLTTTQSLAPARVGGGQTRQRALLVEDQPAVLATVSRMFTQLGYDVCAAPSAAVALGELDRRPDFALMFTDIVLPGGMDGIELAKQVRARFPAMRILLTSGFSDYNRSESAAAGFEILMKPYKRQDLLDRLNDLAPNG